MDLAGLYVLPGFVDMHGHIGGKEQGTPAEYVFKLWMGHGITTVRDPGCGNGLDWTLEQKAKSAKNEITAPRIEAYVFFGQGRDEPIATPERGARVGGRGGARRGRTASSSSATGRTSCRRRSTRRRSTACARACHHAQMDVARINVARPRRAGA